MAGSPARMLAHAEAIREAIRVHDELETDLTKRIDPFAAAAAFDLTVGFRPLDHLSGVYLPATDVRPPGVLVNEQHPYSRQRFSAAHEIGHHLQHAAVVIDQDTEILAARGAVALSPAEHFCEAFASWFLMPRRLVDGTIEALDLPTKHQPPAAIYLLALEFGTSYLATATHLLTLRRITWSEYQAVRKVQPKAIKQQLAGIARGDHRPDVWLVAGPRDDFVVHPFAGDDLVMQVDETPTSGYEWEVQSAGDLPVETDLEVLDPDAVGSMATRRFLVRVKDSGAQAIRLAMRRPWEQRLEREWVLRMDVAPRLHGVLTPDRVLA